MLSKEQLIASIAREIHIIKHLVERLPAGGERYKPTPVQWDTVGLMRNLITCGIVPALGAINKNWDHVPTYRERAESMTQDNFASLMDLQEKELVAAIEACGHNDLINGDTTMPWGEPVKLGQALVDMCLKSLVAYKMQLFLYAKAAGNYKLNTANCWVGMDWEMGGSKEESEETEEAATA